jgi:hypothetical protein
LYFVTMVPSSSSMSTVTNVAVVRVGISFLIIGDNCLHGSHHRAVKYTNVRGPLILSI